MFNAESLCNDLFSHFEQQILFLEKQAETTEPTTDRHEHDGPSRGLVSKHLEILKLSAEIDSLNSVTDLQDGPSQARRTVVIRRFKTLQLLRIWYRERFSERRDGSAGRTVVGTTGRHRLLKEIKSLTNLHDGPSQARWAVTGCVIPVRVGFLVKF